MVRQKEIGFSGIHEIWAFDAELDPGQLYPHSASQTAHPVQDVRIASKRGVDNANWPHQKKISKNNENHQECPGHAMRF